MLSSLQRACASMALAMLAVTLAPAVAVAQSNASVTIKAPYKSHAKMKRLLDTIALRVGLTMDYEERTAGEAAWKTAGAPGVVMNRFFSKTVDDLVQTLELAVSKYPEGGFELHIYGLEDGPDGTSANPEIFDVEATVNELFGDIEIALDDPDRPIDVGYQVVQLGYVQTDRALAFLKTIGYTCVEYNGEEAADSVYDKIFTPTGADEGLDFSGRYPVVVKLIDAAKTSLMDAPINEAMSSSGGGDGEQTLPDLGGLYLHGVTSGEPPQRLLIMYERDKPQQLEKLLNLLQHQIDVPAQQILINALIIELNADRLNDVGLGIDTLGVGSGGNASQSFKSGFGESATNFDPQVDADGNPLGSNFDPFSFVLNRSGLGGTFGFQARIRALIDRGEAEVLSNPSVLVLDGRQARIQIGQNRPVVSSTTTNFAESTEVQYFPIGIVLNLRPRIAEGGGEIVMQVETIVSSVALTGASTEVLAAPIVDNRQVQTFVRVANDTPFIIGGLISTEKSVNISGVPFLSDIPIFGALFRRTQRQSQKKEVIVVLTPHVIPHKIKNFSYVIPQETEVFDSFHHQLFRNAYRVREQDVYDLKFLEASEFYQGLQVRVKDAVTAGSALRSRPEIAQVLAGGVPGEDVLVRRMLSEIVGRQKFTQYLDTKKIIFFEDAPDAPDGSGFRLGFLGPTMGGLTKENNAVILTYDTDLAGTAERPFVQPRAHVRFTNIPDDDYIASLMTSNVRMADGEPDQWSAILTDSPTPPRGLSASTMETLKRVLILKRLLELNENLPLTLAEFYPGRQIVFPTEEDVQERYHLLDPEAMRFFYEATLYYPAFEQEFMYQTRRITKILNGTEDE